MSDSKLAEVIAGLEQRIAVLEQLATTHVYLPADAPQLAFDDLKGVAFEAVQGKPLKESLTMGNPNERYFLIKLSDLEAYERCLPIIEGTVEDYPRLGARGRLLSREAPEPLAKMIIDREEMQAKIVRDLGNRWLSYANACPMV